MSEMKKFQFENGLEELEKIVQDLESGELTLEEALKRYEDGVKFSRLLQVKLEEASKKIEVLTKNLEGDMEAKPLEMGSSEKVSPKKKRAPKADDGELLI